MSRTTLYGAKEDGALETLGDFHNAWLGGMHIWTTLAVIHELYEKDPKAIELSGFLRKPVREIVGSVLLQNPDPVWKLADDPNLSASHHLALLSTFDGAYVTHEYADVVALALETFPQVTSNLKAQADAIRKGLNEGYRFFAWNQTSVSESFWWVKTTDEDEEDDGRMFNIVTDKVNRAGQRAR